jgi:hypothetical protein
MDSKSDVHGLDVIMIVVAGASDEREYVPLLLILFDLDFRAKP